MAYNQLKENQNIHNILENNLGALSLMHQTDFKPHPSLQNFQKPELQTYLLDSKTNVSFDQQFKSENSRTRKILGNVDQNIQNAHFKPTANFKEPSEFEMKTIDVPKYITHQFNNLKMDPTNMNITTFASLNSFDSTTSDPTCQLNKSPKANTTQDPFLVEANSPQNNGIHLSQSSQAGKKQLLTSFHSVKPNTGVFQGVENKAPQGAHQRSVDSYPVGNFVNMSDFSSFNTRPKSRDNFSRFSGNFINQGLSKILSTKQDTVDSYKSIQTSYTSFSPNRKQVQELQMKLNDESENGKFCPKLLSYGDFQLLKEIQEYSDLQWSIKSCCVSHFNHLILLGNSLDLTELLAIGNEGFKQPDFIRDLSMTSCFYILVTNAIYSKNRDIENTLLNEITIIIQTKFENNSN